MNSSLINRVAKTRRTSFLVRYLNLPEASNISDAVWEKFQLDELNNDSMFAIERKCRQVGWSFLIAMRGVADAILDKRSSAYNSINQKEAQEKIRYARSIYYNLQTPFQLPRIITDNKNEIEFDNGARLVSTASARGIPNANFFIDEAAWKKNAREVFTASVPIISKGGTFRMGSSTNGASGIFWEIDTESFQKFPDFVRTSTKWWEVQAFCKDVKEARKLAPFMSTEDRVELFATDRLKLIFRNSIIEDFQQEYEAVYVDETTAWITWTEIQKAQQENLLCFEIEVKDSQVAEALQAIDSLKAEIQKGNVENVLFGGYDVGRNNHKSELFLVGKSTSGNLPLRLMITLDKCDFDSQLAVICYALQTLPIVSLMIDQNGIGNNLAENSMKAFPSKAVGVNFTNATKAYWAGNMKMFFQQGKIIIPVNRDLGYQIHSIKKKVTLSGNSVFDVEKDEKHHADKFWALALAGTGAKDGLDISGFAVNVLGKESPYSSFVV